jgi:hypothetical protein
MIIKHLQASLSPGKSIASLNRECGTLNLSSRGTVGAATACLFDQTETK